MSFKKFSFATIIFLSLLLKTSAQDSLSTDTKRVIDSALSVLNMNRGDLAMPWDAAGDDAHRLEIERELFKKPLKSFDYTQYHAANLKNSKPEQIDTYFADLLKTLNLGTYRAFSYDEAISSDELNRILGVNLEREASFVSAGILRRFLLPVVQSAIGIDSARQELLKNATLFAQADSLQMMSEDSENLSVFDLKREEEEAFKTAERFFKAAARDSMPLMYSHSLSLYRSLLKLSTMDSELRALLNDSVKTKIINTKLGRIAIGGKGDDVYEGDFLFILDAGGNDRYIAPTFKKEDFVKMPVHAIVDISGSDIYIGNDYAFGSGFFNAGMLLDMAGDDMYSAGNFSLGCGMFGVGILHDAAGTDVYTGKVMTEGAGFFGVGILKDDSGNDLYRAYANGQGFGSTRGFGAIADLSGNDAYTTTSPFQDFLRYDEHYVSFTQGAANGYRPIASGGIGLLADFKGNDSYTCDIYGQGTAYWFGLGALYDEAGDDRYNAYQYAQGAGVHLAQGVLWDVRGEDVYVSHGVSQGCGHDIAFGGLLDEAGNDHYFAESLSQGAGNANAVSLLVDERGDDSYIALNTSNTMGFSDFRRDYGMIGIFVDGGGTDLYGETGRNKTQRTQSSYGVFADLDITKNEVFKADVPALTPPVEERTPLATTLDSLFIQASAAPQKYQYNVAPAQERIVSMGAEAIPFLASKLATESARERLALDNMLPKLYDKDSVNVRKFLLDSLRSRDTKVVGMAAAQIGKKKIAEALPVLQNLLKSPNWRVRALAAQQIGEIGVSTYADTLLKMLKDREPYVRARAAYSIGRLNPANAQVLLDAALKDSAQVVRNSAVQGLRKNAPLPAELVVSFLKADVPVGAKRALARLVPSAASDKASLKTIEEAVRAQPESVREAVYRAIMESPSAEWKSELSVMRKTESNAALKLMLPVEVAKEKGVKEKGKSKK
ncbi:MAG: HEAT repeat domain-containing protein [Bacteroidota bacterium]